MGDGNFTVLLTAQRALDVRTYGPLLQELLGLHRIDSNRQVRRQRGFLAAGLDEESAGRLVAALAKKDVPAEVVDSVFIEPLPRPKSAYYVDGWDEGLIVGKEKTGEIPWSRVTLIAVGALLPARPEGGDTKTDFDGPFTGGLSPEERELLRERQVDQVVDDRSPLAGIEQWLTVIDKEAFDLIESDLPAFVLDIGLRDPDQRFRVEGRGMISSPLADERSPNWLRNLWVMTQRLASFVPKSRVSEGAWSFIHQQPSWHLTYDLDTEYDESIRWFWHRRREAELSDLVDEDRAGPAGSDAEAGATPDASEELPAGDES